MSGRWLVAWNPRPHGRPTLLCLPPAGAGCGQFRSWQDRFGPQVSVVGVQLPGRENRWREALPDTMADAVEAITAEALGLVGPPAPLAVFGHSFGGLLGYEVSRRLGEGHGVWPTALVVAACRPPHWWVGAGRGLLADPEELDRLIDTRDAHLDDDMRELAVEAVRRDALFSETYRDPDGARVECSLEVWNGAEDAVVTHDHAAGWRDYAAADFRHRTFPGGHHFTAEHPALVQSALAGLLGTHARVARGDDA